MGKDELIANIRQFCIENSSEELSAKYKRYFKEAPDNYGLSQPLMNEKAKQLVKEKLVTLETIIEATPELLKGKYEETSIALMLINGFEKQYSKNLFNEIGTWFRFSINNWAHADTLGMFILPKFFKLKLVSEESFKDWITSDFKFQRRCVPVTLIKTLKIRQEFSSLFHLLEPMMSDPEREVHQGMGWFLRECWKLKPSETEDFLFKWKDSVPRLIIQYATEKMTAEEKLRFRKSK